MTVKSDSKLQADVEAGDKLDRLADDDEYDYITVPPDGGFGWVVVFACFVSNARLDCGARSAGVFVQMINLIVDGFLYSFGAISEDIKKQFNCDEWAVSLVISVACGFYLLSGREQRFPSCAVHLCGCSL